MKLDLLNKQPNGSTKMFIVVTKPEFQELKRLLSSYILLARLDKLMIKHAEVPEVLRYTKTFFKGLAKNLKSELVNKSVTASKKPELRINIAVISFNKAKGNSELFNSIVELFTNNNDVKVITYNDDKFEAEVKIL